jgi:cytochrome c
MGDLTFNKIAGAVLATFLVIFLLQEVTTVLFEREPPEHPGYAIAVAEGMGGGGGPEAPTGPPDWGTVLPTADIAAGEAIVQSHCTSCHHFDPAGTNGTGPGLFGVLGRQPGSHPGFSYSSSMTAFGQANHAWDYDRLWNFIGGPQRYIEGTRMTFAGLRSSDDRVKVIAYLRSLGSTNVPIPAPHPAAAAPAAAPAAGAPAPAGGAPSATGSAQTPAPSAPGAPGAATNPPANPSAGSAPATTPPQTPAPAAQATTPSSAAH